MHEILLLAQTAASHPVVSDAADMATTAVTAVSESEVARHARDFFVDMLYLVAAVLFVFGLKMLSSPRTARQGNMVAFAGMLVAIVVTLFGQGIEGVYVIILGGAVGALIGGYVAQKVEMTAMPEMVALFNGSGGMASALVAAAEYWRADPDPGALRIDTTVSICLALFIGMITTTGSFIAFLKLSGKWIPLPWAGKELNKRGEMDWKVYLKMGNPLTFPMQHPLNLVLIVAVVLLGVMIAMNPTSQWAIVLLILISTLMGVLLTIPIGGADMPVVVSLLNSYSGLAACFAGFVLENNALIVSGSLVGASGLILTNIMCKAMNRSLFNVLAGGFGQESSGVGGTSVEGKTVRQMDGEEAAMVLEASQKVFIIPGYGMAVAQAQHAVAEMADLLAKKDIDVRYGVHPVAGRMPGHMNVLLAEANVPYEQLSDLDLNSEMEQCDVALVIGANDVVNPDARRPDSQIAGMPIFDVDKARTVMVCKRSLNPGFAGIQNPLFFNENTTMLFGDAKKMVVSIVAALKGD